MSKGISSFQRGEDNQRLLFVVEQVKRYIYTKGVSLKVLSPYAGPESTSLPTPFQLCGLIDELLSIPWLQSDVDNQLREFRRVDSARVGGGGAIYTSGARLNWNPSPDEWADCALKADHALNAIVRTCSARSKGLVVDLGPTQSGENHGQTTFTDPPVDDEDLRILKALSDHSPNLLTQDDIEAASGVSRGTISKRLKDLLKHKLVEQPRGSKSGTTITTAGQALLKTASQSKLAQ